jgi:putative ABC transport system permease protein
VSFALAPGASEPAALRAVDRLLAPYGATPTLGRRDQVSNKFQQDRIVRLRVMATVIPPVFLLVAAALVHLVLGRMVESEREQIGLLKAFGYGNLATALPYLEMAAFVGVAGVVGGGVSGGWLASVLVGVLARYMRFPHLAGQFAWSALAVAGCVSVGAAMAGSLLAVRRAARLSPAVAMQPPSPASFRMGIFESLGITSRLDQSTRMVVRHLERFPLRAVLTTAGLAVSLSLMVASQFLFGAIDAVVDQAYYRARRWSDFVAFAEARDIHAVFELSKLPAVIRAEPFRGVAGHLRAHARDERISVMGLDDGAALERTLTPNNEDIPLEASAVVVSQALAAHLGLTPGETAELEITEGRHPRRLVRISAVAQDYGGLTVRMARGALNRMLGEGDLASGAELLVDADRRGSFYHALVSQPLAVGVGSRDDTVRSFRSEISAAMNTEMSFYVGFAALIAFGITFNISRIALTDRARDLATLCVLGFRPLDCAYILSGELILLALIAVVPGIAGGIAIAQALLMAFRQQDFYLPMVITRWGIGVALSAYFGAVLIGAGVVARRVWQFDLVSVLKTRE